LQAPGQMLGQGLTRSGQGAPRGGIR